ncbi:histidinol phosphate phosphatase [Akkermansia muciniphila]|nr:histidinol phosphate phosphatase [Akkermansia muciniphila]PNC40098.1 histidinol phosphate phosphatase [Akkermansia muciniphila]
MYCDYHTHTPLCLHASGTPQEYVQAAVRAGLREYGISDHAPMPGEPFDDWRMKQADMPTYLDWLTEARECAAPHGLTVRAALECDWFPGIGPWIEHLQSLHAWDYLIGSVHYLGEKEEFDNPYKMDFWNRTDVEDAWRQYWERFRDMAASGLFHIMGHADLIKKFGFRPSGDLRPYYEPSLEAMKESGACLELNTAGWRNKCAEQYPDAQFLKMAAKMNIPLTISSDAHKPEDVGRDFERAAELARQAGFTHLASFQEGRMELYPLPGI